MGEVYRARDTRLDRTVAVKVLPAHLAANPQLRTRFEREARAVSALDHPHICILHDIGRSDELDFLVMQFLEGETLAERLARGPLPLAEALRLGVEIAGALDKAHRAGILHRDLKPGNVMLTRSGSKLLDFGLAKLAAPVNATAQTVAATASAPLTGQGSFVGTLLYMSPEQLEGREVDARSDIFSFGAMLYEMLTGARPFAGDSQASIIAAILEKDPQPLAERAPLTPPALDRVVRKCLAKDPDLRWQSARDLGDELAWIARGGASESGLPAQAAVRRSWLVPGLAAVAIIGVVAGAAAGLKLWKGDAAAAPIGRHLTVQPPAGVRLTHGGIAVAPDGRSFVYVATPQAPGGDLTAVMSRLYLQRADSDSATSIAGTEGALSPFFSPDGLWIGFFIATALMKVSTLGGMPIKITDNPPVNRGGSWGPDNVIVFSPTQSSPMNRVMADGGGYTTISKTPEAQLWPEFLPGGKHVLYTKRLGTSRSLESAEVAAVDLASGEHRTLIQGAGYGRYSPSGHILFARGGSLYAVAFDVNSMRVTGSAVPVADGLAIHQETGAPQFAVAPDGTLYVARGKFPDESVTATWVERTGVVSGKPLTPARRLWAPRLAPDGRTALLTSFTTQGDTDIFMLDVGSASMVRFSSDSADDFNPTWGPAGQTVLYSTFAIAGMPRLVSKPSNGGGKAEPVVSMAGPQFTGSVSSSGVLAFTTFVEVATRSDIFTMPLAGDRTPQPFLRTSADEFGPEFSPDGKWIAYVSNEAGTLDVYVAPFPGPGASRKISSNGGISPAWCRSCGELFFQTRSGMMAVQVTNEGFGEPRQLFAAGAYRGMSREDGPRQYDVTPDGKRFLMLRAETAPVESPARLDVISGWVTRLAQQARPGG